MLPLIRTTEPNSPTALAKARLQPLAIAGTSAGRITRRNVTKRRGPERGGRLLGLAVELAQHRLHAAHDERQRHERERDDDGRARVGDVDADRAALAVERDQREPGDDRRQREGQVDDRVDEALAENSSRSSTHASIVPKIALTTTTISEQTIVSSNAARASGAESAVPEPVEPEPLRRPDQRGDAAAG